MASRLHVVPHVRVTHHSSRLLAIVVVRCDIGDTARLAACGNWHARDRVCGLGIQVADPHVLATANNVDTSPTSDVLVMTRWILHGEVLTLCNDFDGAIGVSHCRGTANCSNERKRKDCEFTARRHSELLNQACRSFRHLKRIRRIYVCDLAPFFHLMTVRSCAHS